MPKASTAVEPVPDINGDRIITPRQAAALLGVTERMVVRTLYRQGEGPLRGFRVAKRYIRFYVSDVEAYVDAQLAADGRDDTKSKKAVKR